MSSSLFRQDAVDAQQHRLYGEIIVRPAVSSLIMTVLLASIVLAAGIAVAMGSYARVETARGVLVPTAGSAKIYALRQGVITSMFVHDEQYVEAGTKLALVTVEMPNEEGVSERKATLDSIRRQTSLASEQLDLIGRRSDDERARLSSSIKGLQDQAQTLDSQLDIQKQAVASSEMLFLQLKGTTERGFVTKVEYERRRQQVLAAKRESAALTQQRISIRTEIARLEKERDQAAVDRRRDQATAESSIESLRQQRGKIQGEAAYVLVAPISGRVTAMQAGLGKTVGQNVPLMAILPVTAVLQAEIYVPTRAIGFLQKGQEVRLLYDAFPSSHFGSFSGTVQAISQFAIPGQEADATFKIDEPVYRVTVFPDQQTLNAFGNKVALRPGMTLTANLVLARESFWDWLLSPLRAVRNRS